jgi:hypothetical protein
MSILKNNLELIKTPEGFWDAVPVAASEIPEDFWGDVAVTFPDSIEIPEDFWKPVPREIIGKVSESIVEDIKLSEMVLSTTRRDFLRSKLIHLFDKGHHYQVRGNGFCFINAVFSILIKKYPIVADYDYNSLLTLFQIVLADHGMVDESPDDLDAVLASQITREVLAMLGIHNASFAIFSLTDFTVSFNVEHSDIENPVRRKDLFCILHTEGHFSGIYFEESDTEKLYDKLTFDMAS